MTFAFIATHWGMWPAGWLCEALGVSRAGFYAWRTRSPSARARANEQLLARVRASFLASDRTYGARLVWHDLLADGRRTPSRRMYSTEHSRPHWPTAIWVADCTDLWTAEGWLYVAVVVDLFSRRVVGWSMHATMTMQLVTDALVMATWRRGKPEAVLHHSDRGSQYTSGPFQRLLADHGVTCSMSRAGNVWDNAAMERVFSSLKTEPTASKTYRTRDQAKADVFDYDYIERFYDPSRQHSTLGYRSPMKFEWQAELA